MRSIHIDSIKEADQSYSLIEAGHFTDLLKQNVHASGKGRHRENVRGVEASKDATPQQVHILVGPVASGKNTGRLTENADGIKKLLVS